MNQNYKFEKVTPIEGEERKYLLYDYKSDSMMECFDRTPELPIYYVEHPTTHKPLYFKLIPGFDGYGVTKEGKVISFKSRHINTAIHPKYEMKIKLLKPVLLGNRIMYRAVGLSLDGEIKLHYVHHIVLECWCGLPGEINPDGSDMETPPECNHKDGDTYNNDYTNLEWCDRYYNNAHRVPYEDWGFQHTVTYNENQLLKFRNMLNDLIEKNEELLEDFTEKAEKQFNRNQRKIDSLEFQINELEFTIHCQHMDMLEEGA